MNNIKLLLFLTIPFTIFSCKKEHFNRPNVIILLSDDQGYGDLSCHGNPYLKTPNLDQLSKESIRFTDFHVSGICTPSRAQLMTGIDAVRNGAYNFGFGKSTIFDSIPDASGNQVKVHLMSEYFKANGYTTGHFGKWHLGDHYPYRSIDRGFDTALTFPSASVWQASNYWNNDGFNDYYYRNGQLEKTEGYCNDLWFDETIKFIANAKQEEKPFFIYLPTSAMHTPLFVPEKYNKPYKEHPALTEQFYGMIANFDENYGKLDNYLKDNNLKDNTIFIYLSDNGGTFGVDQYNAGMKGSKGKIYDGGHRVPCFLRWPKGISHSNREIDDMIIVQDLLPTLVDLCQLKAPWRHKFDGRNIAHKINGNELDLSDRMSVVQFSTKRRGLNEFGVLWQHWRLLQNNRLYNIKEDPKQELNLFRKHPEIAHKMQEYYNNWLTSVQPSLNKNTTTIIGYKDFEKIELTCFDWLDLKGEGNPSQQYDIRQGKSMHGFWNLDFKTAGNYQFTARRWPKSTNSKIKEGLPPYISEFAKQKGNTELPSENEPHTWKDLSVGGIYPKGKALETITMARIIVADTTMLKPVNTKDTTVTFHCDIKSGIQQLQIDFLDANKTIVCGAYYVDIEKRVNSLN